MVLFYICDVKKGWKLAQKAITIYDIAREAHVSPATVSRILSNSNGVRQEKRERVLEVIEKHQFKPNALARGLSETRSRRLGMICPDVRNPFFANVYTECERAAYEKGYTIVFNNTFGQEKQEIESLNRMLEQRVDCMLICGGLIDWRPVPERFEAVLEHCCEVIPVVINGTLPDFENKCAQFTLDAAGGMNQAVAHLVSLGHKRIAFLHGQEYIYQTQFKTQAFRNAMESFHLPVRGEYIINAGLFDEKSGYAGMNRLLSLPELPTAVIAINDLMATGALQAIQKIGCSVPGDFSLISFDDTYLTELVQPNLTSVHYDYTDIGKKMIDRAIGLIDGDEIPAPEMIPTVLKIRESCTKINM